MLYARRGLLLGPTLGLHFGDLANNDNSSDNVSVLMADHSAADIGFKPGVRPGVAIGRKRNDFEIHGTERAAVQRTVKFNMLQTHWYCIVLRPMICIAGTRVISSSSSLNPRPHFALGRRLASGRSPVAAARPRWAPSLPVPRQHPEHPPLRRTAVVPLAAMEVSGLVATCVLMFFGAYGFGMAPRLLPNITGEHLAAVSSTGVAHCLLRTGSGAARLLLTRDCTHACGAPRRRGGAAPQATTAGTAPRARPRAAR